MALQKSQQLETGFIATYFRVARILIDQFEGRAQVQVVLYKDKAARAAGSAPVWSREFLFEGDANPFSIANMDSENPLALAYAKLKELPEFEGAQDA
jgi:leucyl aminopeptidase (aminopeptidase T)